MKKKKKHQKILSGIIIFFTLVIICSLFYIIWQQKPKTNYDKYLVEVQEKINKYNILDQINKEPYSQTLEKMLLNEKFQKSFLDEYFLIIYQEKDHFLDDVNKLLTLNYDHEKINNIYLNYNDDLISFVVSMNKQINFDYLSIPNFIPDNYARYENYQKNKELKLSNIVTYVNIGLDRAFYSQYNQITKPDNLSVLVNKYHQLSNKFAPNNLVKLYNGKLIRSEAKEPLMNLINDAKKVNIDFTPGSVYRSYQYQIQTYNNYVLRDGKTKADTFSARPGFSEHQTGLAVDLATSSGAFVTNNSKEYNWLKENVYKYGFIIRYELGKEFITGYKFEPWHLRYIGVDHAKKIKELNITYDEYYDLFIREN